MFWTNLWPNSNFLGAQYLLYVVNCPFFTKGLCDTRGQETLVARRDGDKLRDDLKQLEAKLSAAAAKLNIEAEAHK